MSRQHLPYTNTLEALLELSQPLKIIIQKYQVELSTGQVELGLKAHPHPVDKS